MPVSQSRSALGNACKGARRRGQDPTTDPQVVEARRQLATDKLADFIAQTVAEAPLLSQDQLDRLSALLTRTDGVVCDGRAGS